MRKLHSWLAGFALISTGACVEAGPAEDQNLADDVSGAFTTTTVNYETFSDPAGYDSRWFDMSTFLSVGDPGLLSGRSISGGRLNLGTSAFTASHDFIVDHMKYFAGSTRTFDIPSHGAALISADISAVTPGATVGRINPVTGRRLMEGQQAAATLSLFDAENTGAHLAWWVSGNKAFALYERVMPDGHCDLSKTYTQIIGEVVITPGSHNYQIELRRNPGNSPDRVRYILDGRERMSADNIGIPLDVQDPRAATRITYPSRGPGEVLKSQLRSFLVGHGVGTMVDEYPFNQCPTGRVSIPAAQRVFGQGITATFDNIRVDITAHN